MGIGLSSADWYSIVAENRKARPCPCTKPENRTKYCTFHGFALNGAHQYGGKITSNDVTNKFIESARLKLDEKGRPVASTARGKRRQKASSQPRQ